MLSDTILFLFKMHALNSFHKLLVNIIVVI